MFGFFLTGYVSKSDTRFVAREHACAAFAKRHGLVVGALCLTHEEDEESDHEEDGEQHAKDVEEPTPCWGRADFDINTVKRYVCLDQQCSNAVAGLNARTDR